MLNSPAKYLDLNAGVAIGLGVDGSASNDGSNMIQEVRQAMLLQRLRYGAAQVSWADALRWGTAGSAAVLHRPELGRLAPNLAADLALFKLDELQFSGAQDPLAALIICGAHRADRVMVNGQWRVIDGDLVQFDLDRARRTHQQLARTLQTAIQS